MIHHPVVYHGKAWDFIVKIKKSTRPHVFRTFLNIMKDFRENKK